MKKSNLVKAFAVMAIMTAGAFFVGCADPSDGSGSSAGGTSGGSTGGSNSGNYGTKAPDVAKAVGDIVYNDGSSTPYTADLTLTPEQKAAAIAVIFKVDGGKALGVGLKHNTNGLAWCTENANAYDKDITSIQCPASRDEGNYTFTGDTDGSDNLEQIAAFLKEKGLVDDTTGTDADKRYPAFYFAKNYKNTATNLISAYESGWYLPTLAELFDIWKVKATVEAASNICGGNQFDNRWYWSSSQENSSFDKGAVIVFDNMWCYSNRKDLYYGSVCAIRAFN